MKEIWKDIPGYEGLYQISNLGNIYIIKRKKKKIKTINKDGYYYVNLSKNNHKTSYLVHRLVAETFLNKKKYKYAKNDNIDEKLLVVNHKDENKLNNCIDNLEWCTNKYNVIYSKNNYKEKIDKIIDYLDKNEVNEKLKKDIFHILSS